MITKSSNSCVIIVLLRYWKRLKMNIHLILACLVYLFKWSVKCVTTKSHMIDVQPIMPVVVFQWLVLRTLVCVHFCGSSVHNLFHVDHRKSVLNQITSVFIIIDVVIVLFAIHCRWWTKISVHQCRLVSRNCVISTRDKVWIENGLYYWIVTTTTIATTTMEVTTTTKSKLVFVFCQNREI